MKRRAARFVPVLILTALCASPSVSAQDSIRYRVHVAPSMEIRALGGARAKTHPMTTANVIFTDERWQAKTSSATGSTVRFTTDQAFRHLMDPSYKRDARLTLTKIVGSTGAGWQFDTVVDTTNYAVGDETATVQVSGTGPGNATIWMDVTFMTGNLTMLKAGQYQMTVVGTISEN